VSYQPRRPIGPFAVGFFVVAIVAIAMFQLPESFVNQLQRNRPLSETQVGWAFRLLALAAVAQAAYGGFVLLSPDRIGKARAEDESLGAMSRSEMVASVARSAATIVTLTLLYGIAAFGVSGERGGFWLFVLITVAQGAWYYRQVGQIAKWLVHQPEMLIAKKTGAWTKEPPDYSPPLARGLTDAPESGSMAQWAE
jgi:hypothetical protein